MITIFAFKVREEALINKALLQGAGLSVALREENGKLQLQVRDSDAELAQDILAGANIPGWRRRTAPFSSGRRLLSEANCRIGGCFFKGGGRFLGGILCVFLLLFPLGVRIPLTPFSLLFLFLIGGCGAVVRHFFRVRRRFLPRRKSVQ
ncbi:MAG TPA: hypothetical protein VK041_01975 [Opitutales bacterium]|nr:hypothetical protein [Opitutales bacterium]